MNLYIIGPVTGIPNENRPEFERVREELVATELYEGVFIPHWFVNCNAPWKTQMAESISELLRVDYMDASLSYDGIAMLDGWQDSKGATIEHDLAEALGIPCKPWREWLECE